MALIQELRDWTVVLARCCVAVHTPADMRIYPLTGVAGLRAVAEDVAYSNSTPQHCEAKSDCTPKASGLASGQGLDPVE